MLDRGTEIHPGITEDRGQLEDEFFLTLIRFRRQVEPAAEIVGDGSEQTGPILHLELITPQAQVQERLPLWPGKLA